MLPTRMPGGLARRRQRGSRSARLTRRDLGFRVKHNLGFRAKGIWVWVLSLGLKVPGLGFKC